MKITNFKFIIFPFIILIYFPFCCKSQTNINGDSLQSFVFKKIDFFKNRITENEDYLFSDDDLMFLSFISSLTHIDFIYYENKRGYAFVSMTNDCDIKWKNGLCEIRIK